MGMTGDAVRQRLAEIQQRAEASSELVASEGDTARSWAAATASALDAYPMVAALTAVLDRCGEREAIATREAIAQGFAYPHAYAEQSSIVTTEQIRRAVAAALEEQP